MRRSLLQGTAFLPLYFYKNRDKSEGIHSKVPEIEKFCIWSLIIPYHCDPVAPQESLGTPLHIEWE